MVIIIISILVTRIFSSNIFSSISNNFPAKFGIGQRSIARVRSNPISHDLIPIHRSNSNSLINNIPTRTIPQIPHTATLATIYDENNVINETPSPHAHSVNDNYINNNNNNNRV